MPNTFRLKRSSVANKIPLTTDLQLGELALNTTDGKLYTKKSVSGVESIVELSAGAIADGDKGDITVSSNGATWTLDPSGVTAGTYGSSTQIPSLTVDAKGRITAASNNAITVGNGTLTVNTSGTGLSGSGTFTANQSTNGTITITSNATSVNTASAIVARDASGNFSAGTITAALSGNATTATTASNLSGFTNSNISSPVAGADALTNNGLAYVTSISLYGQSDGALYAQAYNSTWIHQIYGDYRTGQIAVRGRNNGTWQAWRAVLDASNYTSYAPSLTGSGASGTWSINVTGSASSVAWSGVTGKPTTLAGYGITDAASSTHAHGNITNAGAIGTTSGLPIITTTSGVLTTGSFGTTAGTFCQGNDSRLSDTRNTTNSITFNNGGAGGASGSTFNGSGALTVSYNTVGAPSTTGTNASGTWGINITGSSASCTGNSATATTASNVSATADQAIVNQQNGNTAAWRGRILSKNSTADRAAFLGTYGGNAGVFAHNNALNAWADLYVNTVDGSSGGTVRMPTALLLGGNQALHAGNYTSYSPSLTGSGASGTWGINITGAVNGLTLNQFNTQNARLYTAATGAAGLLGVDSAGTFRYQLYGDGSNYGLLNGAWAGWDLRKANNGELYITVSSVERTVLTSGNYTSYSPSLTGSGASGTWGINITGNSATTSQRTFSNVRTDGINRGSYGTVSIAGTSNGWAGIDFTAAASTLMVTSSIQGFYNNDNAWQWYFQNGVLTAGSVPWSQVTSRPTTLSGYGITDGASVGANGCIQLNNQTISSNYTFTSGQNGVSAGPITIGSGVVVTVTSGCSWSVV